MDLTNLGEFIDNILNIVVIGVLVSFLYSYLSDIYHQRKSAKYAIMRDISIDIEKRRSILTELENRYQALNEQESELSKKIEILKDLPIEVAEYFQQINDQSLQQIEKRRTRRDVLFFILGILFTAIVATLL